jgi:hypothetical protein
MLDLNAIDVEQLASALVDHTDHGHRWLIDPGSGEVVLRATDMGIDGENPREPHSGCPTKDSSRSVLFSGSRPTIPSPISPETPEAT